MDHILKKFCLKFYHQRARISEGLKTAKNGLSRANYCYRMYSLSRKCLDFQSNDYGGEAAILLETTRRVFRNQSHSKQRSALELEGF